MSLEKTQENRVFKCKILRKDEDWEQWIVRRKMREKEWK
jgi:hypothetical protein